VTFYALPRPHLYKKLKDAANVDAAEDILRDKLHEAGVEMSGNYPSKSDIAAVKRKRMKEQELDGIDTSLILDAPRSRRRHNIEEDVRQEDIKLKESIEKDVDGNENGNGNGNENEESEKDEDSSSEASFQFDAESSADSE